jgi:hypothetical protein
VSGIVTCKNVEHGLEWYNIGVDNRDERSTKGMPKATAHCTCRKCGKSFIRTSYCAKSRDVAQWEEWAEENMTFCTDCWKEDQREAKKAKGLVGDIYINMALTRAKGVIMCTMVADGDTYPYKDQLKSLGYRWNNDIPAPSALGDLLRTQEPKDAWNKSVPIDQVDALYAEFEAIGGKGRNCFDEIDITLAQQMVH